MRTLALAFDGPANDMPGRPVPSRSGVDRTRDEPTGDASTWRGKQAIDLVLATAALIASAPLIAVLGAAIVVDSPGPALFLQRRIGRERRAFTLVKLRTMQDGRITRVGRWLRPTGLDELPQLWNVVLGHMSLVGPRPEVPVRVERYAREHAGYHERHRVRPGITGWAQVNGLRGNVSIAERLRFDLSYVRDASPRFDARILRATCATVVRDTLRAWRGMA